MAHDMGCDMAHDMGRETRDMRLETFSKAHETHSKARGIDSKARERERRKKKRKNYRDKHLQWSGGSSGIGKLRRATSFLPTHINHTPTHKHHHTHAGLTVSVGLAPYVRACVKRTKGESNPFSHEGFTRREPCGRGLWDVLSEIGDVISIGDNLYQFQRVM